MKVIWSLLIYLMFPLYRCIAWQWLCRTEASKTYHDCVTKRLKKQNPAGYSFNTVQCFYLQSNFFRNGSCVRRTRISRLSNTHRSSGRGIPGYDFIIFLSDPSPSGSSPFLIPLHVLPSWSHPFYFTLWSLSEPSSSRWPKTKISCLPQWMQ